MRTYRAAAIALLALASTGAVSGDARAAPQASGVRPSVSMTVSPIFGADAALGLGWQELVVSIANGGTAPRKGVLELRAVMPWRAEPLITRAPFNVPAGQTAIVQLPTHALEHQVPTLSLEARDESDQIIASAAVTANMTESPTLIEIAATPRMSLALRGRALPTLRAVSAAPWSAGAAGTPLALAVGAPQMDATTGDAVLPRSAASYSGVTLVVVHSDVLARLGAEPFEALRDWVAGGGTLSVVATRPEDLRDPNLTSMTGGAMAESAANPALYDLPSAPMPAAGSSGSGGLPKPGGPGIVPALPPDPQDEDDAPLDFHAAPDAGGSKYTPIGLFLPTRTSPPPAAKLKGTVPPAIKATLRGYSGGRLVPSTFGATAAFGTGQVHLLAFDPTAVPGLDDAWTQTRVTEMVAQAWDRRARQAFPIGSSDQRQPYRRSDEVRRALDPNENYRPALAFAALLLLAYAFAAGPLLFGRAKKRGTPLSPLKWAPLLSLLTFSAIVAAGLAVKGIRGRGRRISLTELGSGDARGTVTRFRGFYTSESRALGVAATDRAAVLEVMNENDSVMGSRAALRIDRGGSALENISCLPWQTLVVREDATRTLKGPIDITWTGASTLDVTNHSGSELQDALVWVPRIGAHYFSKIKDGETVHSTSGRLVLPASGRATTSAGSAPVHPIETQTFTAPLGGEHAARVAARWEPFGNAAGEQVDWWPDEAPVVMAEIEGGEHTTTDSGLRIESDRALVRIVGAGGGP